MYRRKHYMLLEHNLFPQNEERLNCENLFSSSKQTLRLRRHARHVVSGQ